MTNIKEFLKFGNHLADNSRKISLKFFNKQINIQSKSNIKFDPVTVADTSIQNYINNLKPLTRFCDFLQVRRGVTTI